MTLQKLPATVDGIHTVCVVCVFMCCYIQGKMGASFSSPAAPTVRAEAVVAMPPQGGPIHQQAQPAKGVARGGRGLLLNPTALIMDAEDVLSIVINLSFSA